MARKAGGRDEKVSWTDPAKIAGGTFRTLASGGAGGNQPCPRIRPE
jgi:hypothetical protein